jgi:hypothetical protein
MSVAQERTWRTSRTPEESAGYSVAAGIRIQGRLNVRALRSSLDHIFRRHEILRTTFAERDGRPVQIVHPPQPVDLPVIDVGGMLNAASETRELLAREVGEPFDLERGPLVRLRLVRIDDRDHHLLRINHHIISDGWSWKLLFEELGALYEAYHRGEPPALPEQLPLQYGDFAAWERGWLDPRVSRYREHLAWWRRALHGAPPSMRLPFARATAADNVTPSDGLISWGLPPQTSNELDRLGRQARATHYMVRLAAFVAQLGCETGRDDVVLGTYMTNRRAVETQTMFGLFTNLTTLRMRYEQNLSFREWLQRVRDAVTETSAHAEIPYDFVCGDLAQAGVAAPELRVVFGVADQELPLHFGGLELFPLEWDPPVMPWEFSFMADPWGEPDRGQVAFDARIHDPPAVRAFVDRHRNLVGDMCAHPDRPLRELYRAS